MVDEFEKYTGTETILVADDERILREMLGSFLSEYGYNVMLAKDGQEALDMYHANFDSIHLVLLDIVMPRKDGFATYKEIKERYPDATILFMSGYNDNRELFVEKLKVIPKPFSFAAMVKTIRTALDSTQANRLNL